MSTQAHCVELLDGIETVKSLEKHYREERRSVLTLAGRSLRSALTAMIELSSMIARSQVSASLVPGCGRVRVSTRWAFVGSASPVIFPKFPVYDSDSQHRSSFNIALTHQWVQDGSPFP